MKQKLESMLKAGKMLFLAGLTSFAINCMSVAHYIEARAGLLVPVAEKKQDYNPSFTLGGAYGFSSKEFGLEVGGDYFKSSGEYIKTNSLLSKINLNYILSKPTAKVQSHLSLGVSHLNENSTIDIPEFDFHTQVSNSTWGLEAGIGITILDKLTGKISYIVLPTSENVRGIVGLTCGYCFPLGGKK